MADLVLGIGDFGATRDPASTIKTYALGSCIAVVLLDPASRTVGMLHFALPDSTINPRKAQEKPGYFADTGIPLLFREMTQVSGGHNVKGWVAKLIGGAAVMQAEDNFNIGKRNILAAKKILWEQGLGPAVEDVGGNYSRTVTVSVMTGEVAISCPGRGQWKI
ncbi:CheD activator of MCP protein methylation [Geothermobacter ehrlichii]|uniref:Probable chemoreceptor glutamine deamidase CheD n=1 Tax=Geothermobacter ehrlichii TaxID=213224 RepID=A0A5D3WNS2_9BACT|nr:chemotaxis protein CheD [Geothermobacter ehrlichii]TYP00222.1 CheD activator of MCP protein methylation [Geothermobacter ehrlichii]